MNIDLSARVRGWTAGDARRFPRVLASADSIVQQTRETPSWGVSAYSSEIYGAAIVAGSARAGELQPFLPAVELVLADLERRSGEGQVGWSNMAAVDLVGAFAAMGAAIEPSWLARAATCLPSIRTSRDDDLVSPHWNRGLAALAFDVPAIYRPLSGHERNEAIGFAPRATFELNVQGLLAHLAGAVEQRAALDDCIPAWDETLALFPTLEQAKSLDAASLLWIAWLLHHRLAGQPIATVADFLRDSVYRAADVRNGVSVS